MSEVILEGKDLEKTYEMGDRGLKVLRGVSIEVRRGEILAIQGPSGAGKSTLLHLLGLLDEPDRGEVVFRGEAVLGGPAARKQRYRNRDVGFVFQFYHLFPDLTALENVCLPRMVGFSIARYNVERAAIEGRAKHLLEIVGLSHRMEHRPNELSGGERQRVAIARALMNEPEVLLCDEPTGNLDQKTAGEILDILWRLNAEHKQTFVIVTHDEGLARRAHRVVRVVDGALSTGEGGPPKPRGFAETKFPLREPVERLRSSPLAAGVLAALVPLYALFWEWRLHDRFYRATRRGYSALGTFLLGFTPGPMNLGASRMHTKPLSEADRILHANGEPRLGWTRYLPAWLWFLALNALFVAVLIGVEELRHGRQPAGELVGVAAGAQLALGLSAAWIQSLHNRFYDRMRSQ